MTVLGVTSGGIMAINSSNSSPLQISSLDHIVLTVSDIPRTCRFYETVFGMTRQDFAGGRVALRFGDQQINLHAADRPVTPHARRPTSGSADLCFLTNTPIEEVAAALSAQEIEVVLGPVDRTGARGPIRSVYVRDPDGNLIEIANLI